MKNLHPLLTKKHLLVFAIFTLGTFCFSGVIYHLVSDNFTNTEALNRFFYQLAGITGACNLLFYLSYAFYQQHTPVKDSLNHPPESINTKRKHYLTVLIVDDNPANLLILENQLIDKHIAVIKAASGLSAVEAFKAQKFDMVFMDIEMDEMNGVETTKAIRLMENNSRTPIIAISAHNKDSHKIYALTQGFDDYLSKPLDSEELQKTIIRWTKYSKIPAKNLSNFSSKAAPTPAPTTGKGSSNKKIDNAENIKPVVDIKLSLERSNQNKQLAKDMLNLLMKNIAEEEKNITALYEKQNWETLYQLNHKIYGGSSYCGVPDLQAANQKLERLLQPVCHTDDDTEKIDQPIDKEKTGAAVKEVETAIKDLLAWHQQYDIEVLFED